MDRMNLDEADVQFARDVARDTLPDYETPCPGSNLKVYDDINWYDVVFGRVLWGTDNPTFFYVCNPDVFGPQPVQLGADGITDRAPADPNETPMPIYPPQQFAQQPGVAKHHKPSDPKEAVRKVLKQLDHEHAKKLRALIKDKRPELLDAHESP